MNRTSGFLALLAVVAVSVVFGMMLGGKLNTPPAMNAAGPVADAGHQSANNYPSSAAAAAPDFADIVEAALPAVVGVTNTSVKGANSAEQQDDPHQQFRNDPFFRFFFGPDEDQGGRRNAPEPRRGFASGFIVSQDGYILTNNHVVEDATRIEVTMNDGAKFEAKVIGTDPSIDLALIKIDPKDKPLTVLTLGDSDSLRVGQWVIAIGNPLNFDYTVTAGVVSAKKRRVPIGSTDAGIASFIQTDAAINFGNSGGPLLDARGRVVGINTAITRFNYAEGIGFALPINEARSAMEQLRDTGTVRRGYIGITMNQFGINDSAKEYYGLPDSNGVIVQEVVAGGPADKAGLKRGDVIRKITGEPVKDNQDLVARISSRKPGDTVKLEVFRDGHTRDVNLTLGTRPDVDTMARGSGDQSPRSSPGEPEEPEEASGLGLKVEALTPSLRQRFRLSNGVSGVVVSDVDIRSEAADRGIERDMIVTAINDQTVKSVSDWKRIVRGLRVGAPVRLEIRIPGQDDSFDVFLRVPNAVE